MDKQRLNFFLTCPHCQKKFGIRPEIVLKYLDRLFDQLEDDLREKVEEKVRNKKRES